MFHAVAFDAYIVIITNFSQIKFLIDWTELPGELFYWREKNAEVDFVYRYQGKLYALEVKSGRKRSAKGLEAFMKHFPEASPLIVTPDNFPVLCEDPNKFLAALYDPNRRCSALVQ